MCLFRFPECAPAQPQLKPFHCFALPSWASFGSLPWIGKRLTTRERCRVAADGWSRHPMGRGAFGNQPDEGGSRASQRPLNILPESSWRQATQCWKQTKSSKVMERGNANTAVQCRCHESFTTLPTPLSTHAICYFPFEGSLTQKPRVVVHTGPPFQKCCFSFDCPNVLHLRKRRRWREAEERLNVVSQKGGGPPPLLPLSLTSIS